MTAPTPESRQPAPPPSPAAGRGRGNAVGVVVIIATLVAVGLRLYELGRPGYLSGVSEYDDGTDFGSAVRLIQGYLPYHDFTMVQPPGITLLMAPVALATKGMGTTVGMAVARVLTALASAAAVPLAGLLTRHRGLTAVLVACGLTAVFPDSLLGARTVLLEPWLVLFCLLGALAVFARDEVAVGWRRLAVAGCAFGFAGAVKVWAVLPVLVILALIARAPRRAAVFAAGVAVGFLTSVLPFALTAPGAFYRDVVVAQLVRSDIMRVPFGYRLQHMLGLSHLSTMPTPALVVIGLVVVAAITATMVAGSRLTHARPPALDWFAALSCLVVVVSFLWPADFYYHYTAFLVPFLALAIGLPADRLLTGLRATSTRPRRAALLRRCAMATAALTLVTFAVLQGVAEGSEASQVSATELNTVARLVPPGTCVFTDQVSYTIAINRFVSRVPGCSPMIDGVGTDYALSGGRNGQNGAGREPAVQALWLAGMRSAQFVWLTLQADRRVPWTPRILAYFHAHFVPLTVGPDWLYTRTR
ncbi:MAG TPA: glycosyltransferase family 87 protein [Streptosporangiaceae bacterium]|nr:glycosyltransferase family 87 protein [Streptosporangiaceae bacterium]